MISSEQIQGIIQNYDCEHDKRITFYFEHFECNFDTDSQLFKVAIQHLEKINLYKTARDKIISVNNACKSLILLQNLNKTGSGADDFLPLLIFAILKAKPQNAWTNFFFTRDFVQPWRNIGQEQYYFTAYESALQFIEQIDQSKLKLSQEEYNILFNQYYQQAKQNLNYEPEILNQNELINFDMKKQNQFLLKWIQEFGNEFQQAFSDNDLKNLSFYQRELEQQYFIRDIKISEFGKFHNEYQMIVQKLKYFQQKLDAIQQMSQNEIKDKTVKQKIYSLLRFN